MSAANAVTPNVDAESGAPQPISVQFPTGHSVAFPEGTTLEAASAASRAIWNHLKPEVSALSEGLGGPATMSDAEQAAKNTPTGLAHPWESLKQAAAGVVGSADNSALFDKAKASWDAGDKVTAARHFVNAMIPFVGQNSDRAGDELTSGDYGHAVGHTLAAMLPVLMGGAEAAPEAAEESAASEESATAKPAPKADIPNRSSATASSNVSAEQARQIVQNKMQSQTKNTAAEGLRSARTISESERTEPTAAPKENLTDAEQAAKDFTEKQFGKNASADVQQIGRSNESEAPARGTQEAGFEKTNKGTATEDEINDYVRKQFPNAPRVKFESGEPAPTAASKNVNADAAAFVENLKAKGFGKNGYSLGTAKKLGDTGNVEHSVISPDGNKVGILNVNIDKAGNAKVNFLGNADQSSNMLSGKLGLSGIKNLKEAFMDEHPEVKSFSGTRMGGKRGNELRSVTVPAGKPISQNRPEMNNLSTALA